MVTPSGSCMHSTCTLRHKQHRCVSLALQGTLCRAYRSSSCWELVQSTSCDSILTDVVLPCCAGDTLQGLALMDATAGDGDPFWELYAEHLDS
jgi:hypothetical protein